jgi:hypothetical protein
MLVPLESSLRQQNRFEDLGKAQAVIRYHPVQRYMETHLGGMAQKLVLGVSLVLTLVLMDVATDQLKIAWLIEHLLDLVRLVHLRLMPVVVAGSYLLMPVHPDRLDPRLADSLLVLGQASSSFRLDPCPLSVPSLFE